MEGIAALLGSEYGSCYRGASQLQSHQSHYCATEVVIEVDHKEFVEHNLWAKGLSKNADMKGFVLSAKDH